MNRSCLVLLAVVAAACAPAARADRPLVSETADVIDKDACQVEAFAARTSMRGEPSLNSRTAIFSCGTPWSTQWAVGFERESGGGSSGRALLLGGKTTLVMPEDGRTGWGVSYTLTVPRTGSNYRAEDLTILGLVTRELRGGLLGHANLGWSRSRSGSRNTTVWSLGIETTDAVTLAADVFGDDRSRPAVSVGVGFTLTPGLSANLAVAQQFERPRVRQTSLGLKIAF